MPRPKQRTPELRDAVLRVAVEMLSREGAAAFTTRKVAANAETSTPAVYELFGDKAGLVREMFIEGFRVLRKRFDRLGETADPRRDVIRTFEEYRSFVMENPALAELMFSRPFADFDPGPSGLAAGSAVRLFVVGRVQRCIDQGVLAGDATDTAHVLVAAAQGLAATERAGWLGASRASVDRRWALALTAILDGLSPSKVGAARSPKRRRTP